MLLNRPLSPLPPLALHQQWQQHLNYETRHRSNIRSCSFYSGASDRGCCGIVGSCGLAKRSSRPPHRPPTAALHGTGAGHHPSTTCPQTSWRGLSVAHFVKIVMLLLLLFLLLLLLDSLRVYHIFVFDVLAPPSHRSHDSRRQQQQRRWRRRRRWSGGVPRA